MEYITKEELAEKFVSAAMEKYAKLEAEFGDNLRDVERILLLHAVDRKWMDHIDAMDQLRHGITLRAYAQRDPVIEFKFEGYNMFEEMIANIREETLRHLFRVTLGKPVQQTQQAVPQQAILDGEQEKKPVKSGEKVGRNDLCPCGSGKKYKKCCGAAE